MGRFCQYLPVQIVLTERNKSNYRFPSIVKNNGKEGLELSKVRGEKWLAQFFRKDLIERERERERAWKNKNENNAFCLPFINFFHAKFAISDLKSK